MKSRESCGALSRGRGPPCSALRCSEPVAAPSGAGQRCCPPPAGEWPPAAGERGRAGRGGDGGTPRCPPRPLPAPRRARARLCLRGVGAKPSPGRGRGPAPRCARPQPASARPLLPCGGACSAGLCPAACEGRGFRGKKINKKGWPPVEAARRVFLWGNSQNRAVWWWHRWACTGCSRVSTAKRGPRGSRSSEHGDVIPGEGRKLWGVCVLSDLIFCSFKDRNKS